MQTTSINVESYLKQKLRANQLILVFAILISLFVFLVDKGSPYWSLVFLAISLLSLPAINNCKKDLRGYQLRNLGEVIGEVVDIFPQDEKKPKGAWILFLSQSGTGKVSEFLLPQPTSLAIGDVVSLRFTKAMSMPVEIEIASKPDESGITDAIDHPVDLPH